MTEKKIPGGRWEVQITIPQGSYIEQRFKLYRRKEYNKKNTDKEQIEGKKITTVCDTRNSLPTNSV